MHFGYNDDVNNEVLGSALHIMDGPPDTRERETPTPTDDDPVAPADDPVHENMKTGLIVLGVIITAAVKLWTI